MDDPFIFPRKPLVYPRIIPRISLDYPQIILGLSLDFPWIFHGLSKDYPLIFPSLFRAYPGIIPRLKQERASYCYLETFLLFLHTGSIEELCAPKNQVQISKTE